LLNLIGNSFKFTIKGFVSISLKAKDENILKCKVVDSGVGIEPEFCKKLFKPFVRAQDTYGLNKTGCGLGLCISKTLCEKLGGKITVKSTPNVGSVFAFSIPTNYNLSEEEKSRLSSPINRSLKNSQNIRNSVITPSSDRQFIQTTNNLFSCEAIQTKQQEERKICPCNKILCVDDNSLCRSIVMKMLENLAVGADEVNV
jgi:hypothetical protein